MTLTRPFACCIFLFYWPGLTALADEQQDGCGSLALEDGDGSPGLEMLQMKGSAVSKKACPVPDYSKGERHLKGCLDEDPAQCINSNLAFSTLSDAWAQCGKEKQCSAVLQDTDGNYYLRRESDPDVEITSAMVDIKLFPYNCQEKEEAAIKKEQHEEIIEKKENAWEEFRRKDKTAKKLSEKDDMVKKELAKQKAEEKASNKARQADEDAFDAYVQQAEKDKLFKASNDNADQIESETKKVMVKQAEKQAGLNDRDVYDWKKEFQEKMKAEEVERRVKKAMELSMNKAMDDVEKNLEKEEERDAKEGKKQEKNKDSKREDTNEAKKVEKKDDKKVESEVEKKVEKKAEKKAEEKVERKAEKKVERKAEKKVEQQVEKKAQKKVEKKVEKKMEQKEEEKDEKKMEQTEEMLRSMEKSKKNNNHKKVDRKMKKKVEERAEKNAEKHTATATRSVQSKETFEDQFTKYYSLRHQTMEDQFEHYNAVHQFEKYYKKLPREGSEEDAKLWERQPPKETKEQEVADYFERRHEEYEGWLKNDEELKSKARIKEFTAQAAGEAYFEIKAREKAYVDFAVEQEAKRRAELHQAQVDRELAKAERIMEAAQEQEQQVEQKLWEKHVDVETEHEARDEAESQAAMASRKLAKVAWTRSEEIEKLEKERKKAQAAKVKAPAMN
mmetsp:Transcript_125018/g.221525  ORF Transcript_125018/g.221525 Transcript_125018/m.221525 type:complete len:673 (+) Transcript_125018:91-2109(+)